jgi:hypothetical protein
VRAWFPPSGGGSGGGGGGAGSTLFGTYAARPAAASTNKGSIYVCSDPGIVSFISDGSAWRPLLGPGGGTIGTEVAPGNSLAAYSSLNAPHAFTAVTGCARLGGLNFGTNIIQGKEVARTAGEALTSCVFLEMTPPTGNQICEAGIYVRDSTSDACQSMGLVYSTGGGGVGSSILMIASSWSSSTSHSGDYAAPTTWQVMPGTPMWFRISDDGTDFHFQYSSDGVTFLDLAASAPGGGGPASYDKCGIFVDPVSVTCTLTALSFAVG